ncbi:hypothetical protein [Cupriavidus sp. UYPR2.512]|uniref:hypothetical protein n=1 Tax=Cupriavidus sp. UYPR2.512 TaxID=1080187 RepID=UPI00035DBEBD|nr:hypothetical protein [Cupriavidus sp. UYPR2.512]UIF90867.1 hypothetical protein KAF44_32280 [Cupriavidus necator]
MAKPKRDIDWDAIYKDYRPNVKSVRQIAKEHGISHTAIQKYAEANHWQRDLAKKTNERAADLLARDIVATEVARLPRGGKSATERASEEEIVQGGAEVKVAVQREHRKDIGRLRRIANTIADELEALTESKEEYERAAEMLAAGDEVGTAKALQRAISLPSRVSSLESMSRTQATLIKLEREAFGIDAKDKEESPLEKLLREVSLSEASE